MMRGLKRHPDLVAGTVILLVLACFCLVVRLLLGVADTQPTTSVESFHEVVRQAPSLRFLFGTDDYGRNLVAVIGYGLPMTAWVGFVAGAVGLGIGAVF